MAAGAIPGAWLLSRLGGCGKDPIPRFPISDRRRAGGTDVTFLVAADTHCGFRGIAPRNARQVEAMNALALRDWPWGGDGPVGQPRMVLIAGDLTENGEDSELAEFLELYGTDGRDGRLRWPTRVCMGNHDRYVPSTYLGRKPVKQMVEQRNGGLFYSWDVDDVHFVCLGEYPTLDRQRWLAADLARAGADVPVVLFFHYNILGAYSDWWTDEEKSSLADVIGPFNVVAIFHGHWHTSRRDRWANTRTFNVGSPKHRMHSFSAVRITDETLAVASFNWDRNDWQWAHRQRINRQSAADTSGRPRTARYASRPQ
ncbi:MAG: metallophosphoesterase [Phycisphaerae bacterium]